MAMIKGVTLKALKTHRGHEGEPLQQGNIYMDNKKVGFYSDGDWGGPPTIHFDKPEAQVELTKRVEAYFAENPATFDGADMFFDELIKIIQLEKIFKNRAKQGYQITARFEFQPRIASLEEMVKPYKSPAIWSFGSEAQLQKTLAEEKPVIAVTVRQPNDLVIQ